jgi:hypothetical protein
MHECILRFSLCQNNDNGRICHFISIYGITVSKLADLESYIDLAYIE